MSTIMFKRTPTPDTVPTVDQITLGGFDAVLRTMRARVTMWEQQVAIEQRVLDTCIGYRDQAVKDLREAEATRDQTAARTLGWDI